VRITESRERPARHDDPVDDLPGGYEGVRRWGPAQGVDFLNSVYGALPWIVLLAFVFAYLVLARAFRSLVLPLIAILLDLVSVGVATVYLSRSFDSGSDHRSLARIT